MKLIGLHLHNSLVPIHQPQRYDSKALSQQGCATAGDGHGCSQSRRAGSRGAVINCSVPGRTHSRCSCSTHRASKRCGHHAAPDSRPGTVAGVGLAATHGLRRQPHRTRRRPGPAFDPMFRHARGGGAMYATGCVAGHSAVDCPRRTCLSCSRRSRARRHRPQRNWLFGV
jgi:hypothetical protein